MVISNLSVMVVFYIFQHKLYMKLCIILFSFLCLINCNSNRFKMDTEKMDAEKMIELPFKQSMVQCYKLIQEENPAFWQNADQNLFSVIKEDQHAKKSLKFLVKTSKKIWKEFLESDKKMNSWVIKSSWDCCVADAAEAILDACIENPTVHEKNYSKEELEKLMKYIRKHFKDAPNGLMMNLILQKELMSKTE